MCVPKGVTELLDGTFEECVALKDLSFAADSALARIDSRVFAKSGVTSLAAPSSLLDIGDEAFADCASLSAATLPARLKTIGRGCFARTGLAQLAVPPAVAELKDETFVDCAALTSVEFADDSQLERIGVKTFAGSGLEAFVAPVALRVLGYEAFRDCA